MIFFPSPPIKEELANLAAATESGTALTGSAAMGQVGPIVGRMDIAECEDSYLFRVSLPGVKRDESEFSCKVEDDGKLLIRGLLGLVDPQQFLGNFGTDGILEGIVMKKRPI
ncbi:hypothetical protein REPUB_Repub06bG0021300 [Reevesia pubescens]